MEPDNKALSLIKRELRLKGKLQLVLKSFLFQEPEGSLPDYKEPATGTHLDPHPDSFFNRHFDHPHICTAVTQPYSTLLITFST
jgi:hypothetical protein